MKGVSKLFDWFWSKAGHYPIVRRLRPRLMTMILALVLPVSVACIAISLVSAVQTSNLVDQSSYNAFSMYLGTVALRYEYEGIDPLEHFPDAIAANLNPLYREATATYGGSIYVSMDGHKAWQILNEGESASVSDDFQALLQTKSQYLWQPEDGAYQVLVTFPYNFSMRFLPSWFWVGIVLSAITLLFCPLLYKRLKFDILDPMDTMDMAIEGLKADRSYRVPEQTMALSDDFLKLFSEFNAMAQEVQASHEKDVKMLEAEMENLRLQVNPHMLLNSYNMIYALAQSRNFSVIQDYTLCLVDYFRYVLRQGNRVVSIRQELEFVDNFIRIQRIRFPGRFSYVYQAEEDCLSALIPPLLIENFVENAIKYALEPEKAIEIVVSVRKEQEASGKESLHIAITDTGSGIRPDVLERLKAHEPYIDEAGQKHIGIHNCIRRIELFYGEEGDIHFSSGIDQGTQIYLVVPYRLTEQKEAQS